MMDVRISKFRRANKYPSRVLLIPAQNLIQQYNLIIHFMISQPNNNELLERRWRKQIKSVNLTNLTHSWIQILPLICWAEISELILVNCDINGQNQSNLSLINTQNIQALWINYNKLTAQSLIIFLDKPLKNIRFQTLSQNKIGSSGAKLLIKINLPELKKLFLRKCCLGNEGIDNLAKGKWDLIQEIYLEKNNILLNCQSKVGQISWRNLHFILTEKKNWISLLSLSANGVALEGNIQGIYNYSGFRAQIIKLLRSSKNV